MTVMQSYSLSLTYTSLRMYLPPAAPASVPASSESKPPAAAGDTVTLSPEATVPAPAAAETSASTPAPPASRAARRADVLLNALDSDQDGAVTKEEFVEGAMALLRRAGARHHHRHHRVDGDKHDRHEGHGMRRLERKLDRLFDRVDDSGDGSVDQAELTDALAKVTRERRPPATTGTPAPSEQQPSSSSETPAQPTVPHTPPAAALSYTSVTVTIAVKQYTSVAAMKA